MTREDRKHIEELIRLLDAINRGEAPRRVEPYGAASPDISRLSESVCSVINALADAQEYILAIAAGRLDVEPPRHNDLVAPFRELHSHLRKLAWQTQQIAAGDLNQRVNFFGDFSVAFNAMIAALQEKRVTEERLRYMSNHDMLTDLYNRSYFNEEMGRIERGRSFPVSIIVADIDGLKKVNDTLGHEVGDLFIQAAAETLRLAVRGDDILARIGGDEFAIILPGTGPDGAARVIDRIREYEATATLPEGVSRLGISLGMATGTRKGPLSEILRLADQRMYDDKIARKGGRRRLRKDR